MMKKSDQGFDQRRYKVVLRSLIFVFHENHVLLLKGASDKRIWPNLYNGIGGHIERGEDVVSSARRELFEEAGIMCDDLSVRGSIVIDIAENEGIQVFIFMGQAATRDVIASSEGELHWVSVTEINEYPLVEDLYTLLPKVTDPNIHFISAHYHYENDRLVMSFTDL